MGETPLLAHVAASAKEGGDAKREAAEEEEGERCAEGDDAGEEGGAQETADGEARPEALTEPVPRAPLADLLLGKEGGSGEEEEKGEEDE